MMQITENTLVTESIDHLFRHHSGQMVSVLSRLFGFEKLDLIEDAIQDALIRALKTWSFKGIPENPRAWLIQVAKNRIIDQLRRSNKFEVSGEDFENVAKYIETTVLTDSIKFENEIKEDVLQMMFACCHPIISPDSQVALTLKTVSGFSVGEISAAFLSNSETVAKLLTRAKQKIRERKITPEIPKPQELKPRLDSVIKVLYLIFNEGYNAFNGENLIRNDLCFEAIRLGKLLTHNDLTKLPKIHALLALFFFQTARLNARFDEKGDILLLAEQNRELWDKKMIAEGLKHFKLSAQGDEISDIHIESEIAAIHTLAKDFDSTDWQRILDCYEKLYDKTLSPIVALNKFIALSKVKGAKIAIEELEKLKDNASLKNYLPFYIALGELQKETDQKKLATESFQKALNLANNDVLRRFIKNKTA
jgi:RNA polymerase sigma factor (sigma-70 family)